VEELDIELHVLTLGLRGTANGLTLYQLANLTGDRAS
jgi:hypothetical protein